LLNAFATKANGLNNPYLPKLPQSPQQKNAAAYVQNPSKPYWKLADESNIDWEMISNSNWHFEDLIAPELG
jgi:hypothetical protein